MDYLNLINADRIAFARLTNETARRTGGRTINNVEVIRCDGGLAFICADIGGETATHCLELPPDAWTPALSDELVRLFRGSAEIALRQIGGATA